MERTSPIAVMIARLKLIGFCVAKRPILLFTPLMKTIQSEYGLMLKDAWPEGPATADADFVDGWPQLTATGDADFDGFSVSVVCFIFFCWTRPAECFRRLDFEDITSRKSSESTDDPSEEVVSSSGLGDDAI